LNYTLKDRGVQYDFDELLFQNFRSDYLLNKVLNNNGYISYQLLAAGSCSLPERPDVKNFQSFIQKHFRRGQLLDIGCGPMSLPGYLEFTRDKDIEVFGLDPIASETFEGFRVTGCSEYTPFKDNYFDVLTFVTSLDHVCSLEQTIRESHRILKPGGRVLIFMGDRTRKLLPRIRRWILAPAVAVYHTIRSVHDVPAVQKIGRYVRYRKEGVVLLIPPGAIDPFHSFFESPKLIEKKFVKNNFRLLEKLYRGRDEVFLAFEKLT
jgi:SAM-dependent methyltransferase